MSLLSKLLAAGFAASIALVGPFTAVQPAGAQPVAAPLTVPLSNPITAPLTDPADAAARYIIGQLVDQESGKSLGSTGSPAERNAAIGNSADAILLLTSAGNYPETTELSAWLAAQEPNITDPVQAAKVVVALHEAGADATVIAKLVDKIVMNDDGSVGGWASAFTQAWPIIALASTGHPVPQAMVDHLFTHQGDSGMFGYPEWGTDAWVDDADGTAMALMALTAVRANPGSLDLTEVDAQYPRVIAAALAAKNPSGYWEGYSPVNSTGLMAFALHGAGQDIDDSVAWMIGQQLDDGGLASTLNGTSANVMATLQGGRILGLTGDDDEPTTEPTQTPTTGPTTAQPTTGPTTTQPTTGPTTGPTTSDPSGTPAPGSDPDGPTHSAGPGSVPGSTTSSGPGGTSSQAPSSTPKPSGLPATGAGR